MFIYVTHEGNVTYLYSKCLLVVGYCRIYANDCVSFLIATVRGTRICFPSTGDIGGLDWIPRPIRFKPRWRIIAQVYAWSPASALVPATQRVANPHMYCLHGTHRKRPSLSILLAFQVVNPSPSIFQTARIVGRAQRGDCEQPCRGLGQRKTSTFARIPLTSFSGSLLEIEEKTDRPFPSGHRHGVAALGGPADPVGRVERDNRWGLDDRDEWHFVGLRYL